MARFRILRTDNFRLSLVASQRQRLRTRHQLFRRTICNVGRSWRNHPHKCQGESADTAQEKGREERCLGGLGQVDGDDHGVLSIAESMA